MVETLSVLGVQNRIAIQRLIRAISDSDILAVRKAGYLYNSCGNQAAIDELGMCVLCVSCMLRAHAVFHLVLCIGSISTSDACDTHIPYICSPTSHITLLHLPL